MYVCVRSCCHIVIRVFCYDCVRACTRRYVGSRFIARHVARPALARESGCMLRIPEECVFVVRKYHTGLE